MKQSPSSRLKYQLQLVEHASVSTLHSFCYRLIRQNFNRVGLDPEFRILDEDEAVLLKSETAADLFDRKYDTDDSGNFQRLIDAYGEGMDQRLMEKVIQTHDLLCSLADKDGWIARSRTAIAEMGEKKIESTEYGSLLIEEIKRALGFLQRQCEAGLNVVGRFQNAKLAQYEPRFEEFLKSFRSFENILTMDGIDAAPGNGAGDGGGISQSPPLPVETPGKELVQDIYGSIRFHIKDDKGKLSRLAFAHDRTWQTDMRAVVPHANVFLELVAEFGNAFDAAKNDQRGGFLRIWKDWPCKF